MESVSHNRCRSQKSHRMATIHLEGNEIALCTGPWLCSSSSSPSLRECFPSLLPNKVRTLIFPSVPYQQPHPAAETKFVVDARAAIIAILKQSGYGTHFPTISGQSMNATHSTVTKKKNV